MKQTKIVASISDRRCSVDYIRELFEAGANVVRMNTAHATPEGLTEIIRNTRAVSPHLAIMIDTKGPEIRTTACQQPITYKAGEEVSIIGNPLQDTTHDAIALSYEDIAADMHVGDHLLFDDGALDMEVTAIEDGQLRVRVMNDGVLGSHKSVNVPSVSIQLPALTEKDRNNILFAIEQDIDFIAHSFVRSAADVQAVQEILDEHRSDIKIISKIENQEGVDNIDEIIEASYGIMIARGDLGIEVPIERIPGIQRNIIRKCMQAKKPVIVATQMLHTMIENPRPTRAEVTDIANAIYYRTDALMLSGETASGKYPVEAVRTMAAIAEQAENDKQRNNPDYQIALGENPNVTEFLARNAIESTNLLGVRGIITDSVTGLTARNLAAFRGPNPVLAICSNEKTMRALSLSYGVIAVAQHETIDARTQFLAAVRMLRQRGYLSMEDKIAHLSGNFGSGGLTSFLAINTVQDIFDRLEDYNLASATE